MKEKIVVNAVMCAPSSRKQRVNSSFLRANRMLKDMRELASLVTLSEDLFFPNGAQQFLKLDAIAAAYEDSRCELASALNEVAHDLTELKITRVTKQSARKDAFGHDD